MQDTVQRNYEDILHKTVVLLILDCTDIGRYRAYFDRADLCNIFETQYLMPILLDSCKSIITFDNIIILASVNYYADVSMYFLFDASFTFLLHKVAVGCIKPQTIF